MADAEDKARGRDGTVADTLPLHGERRAGVAAVTEQFPSIEGYQITGRLGEGGMGVVWQATQLGTHRQVALKLLSADRIGSSHACARFEREVELAARLEHPNIARVYDSGLHRGVYYYAMELVDGVPLDEYVQRHNLTQRQILEIMREVCLTVQHAHQHGVIHRDLKPSNIPVDENGVPHVLDFGLAKTLLAEEGGLTVSLDGEATGTPAFMSPEQAAGRIDQLDARTDVYSLGVILFHLLTGKWPHELSGTKYEVMQRVAEEDVHRPREVGVSINGELEALLLRALARAPNDRYASAGELTEDIENYLAGSPLKAKKPALFYLFSRWLRRHRVPVAILALVPAMLAAVVFLRLPAIVAALLPVSLVGAAVFAYVRTAQEQGRALLAHVEADRQRVRAEYQARRAEREAEGTRRALYANRIALAGGEWERLHLGRVRDLLDLCPRDLRGFEWHLLQGLRDLSIMTMRGHTKRVRSVAFSPDGRRIVSASADRTLRIWEAATGEELLVLRGHGNSIVTTAFSPDGAVIASGGADETVRLWDAKTGAERKVLRGLGSRVTSVAVSPNGCYVAAACWDGTIRLWDVTSWQEIFRVSHPQSPVAAELGVDQVYSLVTVIAFSPDAKVLATGGWDGFVRLWDVPAGTEQARWLAHGFDVLSLAFSADGRQILTFGHETASDVSTVGLWDAKTGKRLCQSDGGNRIRGGHQAVLLPDAERVATSVLGGIRVWNIATGKQVTSLYGHDGEAEPLAVSPDGSRIVSGGSDGELKLWDPATRVGPSSVCGAEDRIAYVFSVAFSADGSRMASGSFHETHAGESCGIVKVWDARQRVTLLSVRAHQGRVWQVGFSPDGDRIVSGGEDGMVRVWDAATGRECLGWRAHAKATFCTSYSPDGSRIVSGGADGVVRFWDAMTGRLLLTLGGPRRNARFVAFSPDGKQIASSDDDGFLGVWDAQNGKGQWAVNRESESIRSGVFSSDSQRLYAGGRGLLACFDAATGNVKRVYEQHGAIVRSVSLSPDGARIATGNFYGLLTLWNTEAGEELLAIQAHELLVQAVAFSPDGQTIVSGSTDGTVRFWDAGSREGSSTLHARNATCLSRPKPWRC